MLNFEREKSEVVLLRMHHTSNIVGAKVKSLDLGNKASGEKRKNLILQKISFTLLNKMKTGLCHSNNSSIIDTKLGIVELLGSDQQYSLNL